MCGRLRRSNVVLFIIAIPPTISIDDVEPRTTGHCGRGGRKEKVRVRLNLNWPGGGEGVNQAGSENYPMYPDDALEGNC